MLQRLTPNEKKIRGKLKDFMGVLSFFIFIFFISFFYWCALYQGGRPKGPPFLSLNITTQLKIHIYIWMKKKWQGNERRRRENVKVEELDMHYVTSLGFLFARGLQMFKRIENWRSSTNFCHKTLWVKKITIDH